MKNNKLHIISFDVPYPADYGGVIDVYYKLKAMHEAGAEIYLHCFAYGRAESNELAKRCKEVWYYPRKTGIRGISLSKPYIVNSRRNELLLQRLQQIDAPILFEGVHTTYYIDHPTLAERVKAIRTHNVEWDYYHQLYAKETQPFKKLFFKTESRLLKAYEGRLQSANVFLPLSMADTAYFQQHYPTAKHNFIAPFHPYNKVESKEGRGDYCLYHGNLSHPENIEAVLFLLQKVFNDTTTPLIIAGKNPDQRIVETCSNLPHCSIVANPDEAKMQELISNAQVHIMPTFQPTGMKLKLLYALFKGRHVLVNDNMLHGTGLSELCRVADTAADFKLQLLQLMNTSFTQNDIALRNAVLQKDYNNQRNAEKILTYLQGSPL